MKGLSYVLFAVPIVVCSVFAARSFRGQGVHAPAVPTESPHSAPAVPEPNRQPVAETKAPTADNFPTREGPEAPTPTEAEQIAGVMDAIGGDSPIPSSKTQDRVERGMSLQALLADDEVMAKLATVEKVECESDACLITVSVNPNSKPWELAGALVAFAKTHREVGEQLTLATNDPTRPFKVTTSYHDAAVAGPAK